MKNPFIIEQLEPRILLSGDILSQLVPLLTSEEATMMQVEYLQEHPDMRRAIIPASVSSVVEREPLCIVVMDNKDVSITEEGLMQPFDNSAAFVGGAVEQPMLFADFSSDYHFSDTEWDALEDGWRNLSSMLGETLTAEGFVPVMPFLDGGSKFYGTGDELTDLLQQPLADYGSSFGESVGGLLDVFSKQWSDGDLVVLGKILGGYDAAKNEARFDLTVQIEKSGKSALDFSSMKDNNGLNLTVQDQADYKASLTLDLQFGLDVATDTFFAVAGDGLLSIKVDDADVAVEALFQSPAGVVSSTASGDIELDAAFHISSVHRNLFVTAEQPLRMKASSADSGMQLALSFAGDNIYRGIESVSVSSSDLFDSSSPQIALEGGNLHLWNSTLDANLYVGSGEKLSGSGTLSGILVNAGLVSPGNSPGIQSVVTYTQNDGATLQIEIGGLTPGPGAPNVNVGYDQLNVTGAVNFGGALQVVLLDGFKPTVGDTFDIITFGGTASGIFTNLTGLYGFDSDHYFEVVQTPAIAGTAGKIQLVTREIITGDDFSFVTDAPGSAYNDSLGMMLNTSYLTSAAPVSVTLSGTIELGNSFKVGGSFTFAEQLTPTTLTLSDSGASQVSTTSMTVGGRDLTLLFGSPADGSGLSISDVDFGLAQFKPVDQNDSRSWLMTKGSIGASGSASFVNLGPLSVSSGLISFDISQGLGAGNTTVANLSSSPVVISDGAGMLVTFDSTGSRGEYFDIAATALKFSLADTVSVEGDFMFSSDGTRLAAIGSSVNALFGAADMNIGVTNATIALLASKSVGMALQASGEFSANLGSDISLSATGSSLLWKDDGATILTDANKTLTIGSSAFTFSDELVASTGIQEVRVSGAVLQVGDFFTVSGNLAFQKSASDFVDSKGVTVHADVLTLGSTGLNVFVGANGEVVADRMGLSLSSVDFALAVVREQGSTRQWTALKGSAQSASALGIPDVTLSSSNLSVVLNLKASDGTVIDFSQTAFQVATGVDTSVTLDFSGSLVKAAGTFDVGVADFLSLTGSIAIEKKSENLAVQASDGTTSLLWMDILTLGGTGIDAFVGINGGSAQKLGLVLAGTKVAILMVQEQANKKRKWSAIKAGADSAALVGVDGMTLASSDLSVEINRASTEDASLLDFAAGSYQLLVGPAESVAIDFNADKGALLQASGNLTIDLFGFVQVSGEIALEKSSGKVKLSDEASTEVSVDLLTLGGSGMRAFAGLNGGESGAMGLELSAVNFALATMTSTADKTRSWTSMQASAASAGFIGVDGLTIGADTLSVAINQAGKANDSVVDYGTGKTTLEIATGTSSTLKLSMDGSKGEMLEASGNLMLDVFGFFQVSGGFAFEKKSETVMVRTGAEVVETEVNVLTIGASNVNAFAGLNGGTAEELGLKLTGTEFALVLASEKAVVGSTTPVKKWTSLQAGVESVSFVGVEGLTIAANTLTVEVNKGFINTDGTTSIIDYAAQSLEVATGPTNNIELTMDGSKGDLISAKGNLEVDVFGFFQVSGGFAFEKKSETVMVRTGAEVVETEVNVLTIGASNVNAFAGLNGGTAEELGLKLTGTEFALVLASEKAVVGSTTPVKKWTSLQAGVESVSFVGVEGLTIAANTL
ncbi:MAG: LEPR-XLL domain-containing protein, partial [Chlorobium sp.]